MPSENLDPPVEYNAIMIADNGALFRLDFRGDDNQLAQDHLHHVIRGLTERDFDKTPRGHLTVFWKRAKARNYHQLNDTRHFG